MVVTPNNNEPHFISKEVSDGLSYTKSSSLVKYFSRHNLDTLTLTKDNGLNELKFLLNHYQLRDLRFLSPIKKQARHASLIPASSLQEYLLLYANRPEAKVISEKLYQALEQGQPELTEAEGFGSEFASWYFERVVKSRYLRSWNRRERKYNWLMNQSLGFYFSFHLR